MQRCQTPSVVKKLSDRRFPCLTRDLLPVRRSTMSLGRKDGTPMQRRAFQRAFLTTDSKAALMSMYTTFVTLQTLDEVLTVDAVQELRP